VLVVTISMLLAPLSFIVHRALERWLERTKPPEFDLIDGPGNPVIIAGYGRYGQIVRASCAWGFPSPDRGKLPAGRFRAPFRRQGVLQ
jgi:hypothetical protein